MTHQPSIVEILEAAAEGYESWGPGPMHSSDVAHLEATARALRMIARVYRAHEQAQQAEQPK